MMEVGVSSTIRHVYVIGPGYRDYETEAAILAPFGVAAIEAAAPEDPGFSAALARADAVLVREAKIDRSVIERLTRCQVITRYGIGVDNVDLEAARERRIYVANTPGYGIEEVSTHALALLLAVARRVPSRDRAVRAGGWSSGRDQVVHSLAGRTVGLVGYGRIARAFRKKLAPFAPKRTLVVDPYLAEDPPGVERVDIATLCAESDLISLHAPLTSETRHVIGAAELARMQPTTILVNTARGGLIDEAALVDALRSGRIFGAGLDVFEQEPPPTDHPLWTLDNVVLTDHTAWYSEASVRELQTRASQEVARVFSGQPPGSWVNRW
jgi:D-3-phosphoglycerate dehydrogenase / 2-oxoglutarate reductase